MKNWIMSEGMQEFRARIELVNGHIWDDIHCGAIDIDEATQKVGHWAACESIRIGSPVLSLEIRQLIDIKSVIPEKAQVFEESSVPTVGPHGRAKS